MRRMGNILPERLHHARRGVILALPDDSISTLQDGVRNCHAELTSNLEVDDELAPGQLPQKARTGQTALASIAHDPKEEQIRIYGDIAVYTALMTVAGQYSGQARKGQDRVLSIWTRRDGRWQQIATQMTPVAGR